MNQRLINNFLVIIIIICSTSLYNLSILGPGTKIIELLGIGIIVAMLVLNIVYARNTKFRHHFFGFILLILLSLITSMLMAKISRNQSFADTLYAQRAIYYYLFYFLLHELKIRTQDLEKIFIVFGLIYPFLYLFQFFIYPKIIFDVTILFSRGTVRIFMPGSDYMAISYFMSIQAFLRTNRIKYLILMLLFFSIFILLGGRETMSIMAITLILFIIFSKKVKSRLFISILVLIGVGMIFYMFQDIFLALIQQSKRDTGLGSDYVRIIAAKYFLTDFFKNPIAYFTGNGMFSNNSSYGIEIARIMSNKLYLGDIGLIGNYVIYGPLFVIGVLGICIKALRMHIDQQYTYIKYMFIAILLSLMTGGAFVKPDFICLIVSVLYLIDASQYQMHKKSITNNITQA
jgi:hypothetical protein